MIKRLRNFSALFTGLLLLLPVFASAHVIVTPSQAAVGDELVFNVSSPNEQQTPIIKVTLDMPSGVSEVVPTAKDGWTITTTTTGSGDDQEINTITWSGSQIPVGQREDFGFGAQVPGNATTLNWKAYQTYADGTVVHWDQTPNGKSDDATGNAGPYSVTKVVNDLTAVPATPATAKTQNNNLALFVAIVALIASVGAFLKPSKK